MQLINVDNTVFLYITYWYMLYEPVWIHKMVLYFLELIFIKIRFIKV